MRPYIIGLIAVGLIALAVVVFKPVVEKARAVAAMAVQYPTVVEAYNTATTLNAIIARELEVSTRELEKLVSEWEKKESKQVEALQGQISDLMAIVVRDTAKVVNVPQQPQNTPETLDSALYHITIYHDIINGQLQNIETLQAINTNQGIIIQKQDAVIQLQSRYIDDFQQQITIHKRRSNRNIMIGTAIGIMVGVLL